MSGIEEITTTPYKDQKPGTSGLRKKVPVFQQPHYTANFIQSTFDALVSTGEAVPEVLVVGGDGRYYLAEAVQVILQVAAANGVRRVWVGQHGLLSTPAVSAIIRRREGGGVAQGAFILTASHNPGGPDGDFGIKYNCANGGPAPEKLTSAIYEHSLAITTLRTVPSLPPVDLSAVATHERLGGAFTVEVIDPFEDYVAYMRSIFDFDAIRTLVARPDFTLHLDALHGASGPYLPKIFTELLGVPASSLHHTDNLPDFGGCHPDPNLTYAADLVQVMGLRPDGSVDAAAAGHTDIPSFGAAFDGDADRNMILGSRFFVNPSDSLAVLAANAAAVPFFAGSPGLRAVARSMPTSGAVDRVAEARGLRLFEVPTGWKFFGNLMDSKEVFGGEDYTPLICGEESFGTGSNHVREKDGIWAALFWLSILAARNRTSGGGGGGGEDGATVSPSAPLVTVQDVVEGHWAEFGRNYYSRYDYEGVSSESADAVMARVLALTPAEVPALRGQLCATVDSFEYHDCVDQTVSRNQGARVLFADGSRFVLRLSGTGSSGATIRLYLEQYMPAEEVAAHLAAGTLPATATALKELIELALQVSEIASLTGREAPTVIT